MAHAYDLFVLLDPETPEERRTALVEQLRSQIGSGGATLKGDADWGMRRLSYEIDHRREAQYHLFQFEGTPEVLTQLNRSLSIEDAVLRHRIIRLPGEAPETTPRPSEEPPRRMGDDRGPRDGGRDRRGEREGEPEAGVPQEQPATTEGDETAAGEPATASAEPAPEQEPQQDPETAA